MKKTEEKALEILGANNWVQPGETILAPERRRRMEAYARFHRLNPTVPNLPELIVEHAKQPRCQLPDLPEPFDPTDTRGIRAAQNRHCKWPHHDIRVWHDMTFSNVPLEVVERCWRAALASWEAVCNLKFVFVQTKAEANIFAHAQHIDRASNVLAWSMLPCGIGERGQCEQRYDLEPWERYGTNWSGLQEVMAHELGHALGLDHLPAGNLLQPFATFQIVQPQQGDIVEAQARYGPPIARPPEPPELPDGPDNPPPAGTILLGDFAITTSYTGRRYRLVLVDDGVQIQGDTSR